MTKHLVPLLLTAACATPAPACDLCSIFSAQEAQGGNGKGFFGGAAEQFSHIATLQSDGKTVRNDGERLDSLFSQVFAGYNFHPRFGVQLNVPIIYREYQRRFTSVDDGHEFSPATRSEAGLGDISLIGNIRVYQHAEENFSFNWTALAGLKLPTGETAHLRPSEPDFSTGIGGHDLTLGSGSVDGLLGTGVFTRWHKLFLTANVQYSIRSEGAHEYQFANDLTWSGGPGAYLVLGHEYTLAVQAVVSGEYKRQDKAQGLSTDDTAETMVYLGPQVNFTWGSKLSAQIGADLPVSQATTANQLVPDYRVHGAVTFRF